MKNSYQVSLNYLRENLGSQFDIAVVLGSGLGAFVNEVKVEKKIPFDAVPEMVPTTVEGHSGNFIAGKVGDKKILIQQGRLHFYEGHPMELVVYPIRLMALLGIKTVLLTNSAGGLGDGMKAGDFMIIEDHINLFGTNPLLGPNQKEFGPRFPDMTEAYNRKLIQQLEAVFRKLNLSYHKGIYGGLTGPTYETPAEVRYLKQIGCHAVGMSTVPETIAAHHMGMQVAGISCISNLAAGISPNKLSHDEVTENAKLVEKDFAKVVKTFIENLQP
ncbi:MAG: purine-nucleoside phosphorylase [Pseudobdellovibrionaceae bacterium]